MAQVKQNKGYLQREIKLSWIGNVMFMWHQVYNHGYTCPATTQRKFMTIALH